MPVAPSLLSLTYTQPTGPVPTGTITLVVNPGDSSGPLTINIPGITNGNESMYAPTVQGTYAYTKSGIAPGNYTATILDASPAQLPSFTQAVDIIAFVGFPACTDKGADNYEADPSAYNEPAMCTYSPKFLLTVPPALGALGRPLWASLASTAVVWSTPSHASGIITFVAAPTTPALRVLTVNGYRFELGPLTAPNRFSNKAQLVVALSGVPALAAAYLITATATGVQLTARTIGPLGNVVLTTADPAVLSVSMTEGQPATHSQHREAWGCWLEVWAVPGLAYGATAKANAVLADRFESRYREDNRYSFDLAACLREFTGLSYDCSDRLIGYFLRYGETYADAPGGYRRPRPADGESDVFFGLEAVEIVDLGADALHRVLSKRPQGWGVVDGQTPEVAILPAAGPAVAFIDYTGDTYPMQRGDSDTVTFANGQGGRESVCFEGLREEITKRTASLFANAAGRGTQKAELPLAWRLNSGTLLRPEWDWLRLELGNSPAAWLETPYGPEPINITALTAESDEVNGKYSLLVECEYCDQPALGLTA